MKSVIRFTALLMSLIVWCAPAGAKQQSTVSQKSKLSIQKHHVKRVSKSSKARKSKSKVARKKPNPTSYVPSYGGGYGPSSGSKPGAVSNQRDQYGIKPAFGNFDWAKRQMEERADGAKKNRK